VPETVASMETPLLIDPVERPAYTPDPSRNYRTEWENRSCCCCQIAFFPVGRFYICGHWLVSIRVPIMVTLSFLITHGIFIYDTYSGIFPSSIWLYSAISIVSFVWLCLSFSYYFLICRGPGYVPYTWSTNPQDHYDWPSDMSNIVVFAEQAQIARSSPRPPRASFSQNARRYVLRADHFCLWGQSWIGLKNHRFFLLMTFYAFLYMVCYVGFRVFWFIHIIKEWTWLSVIGLAATLFVIIAGSIGIWHFCFGARNVIWNLTNIELHKGQDLSGILRKFDRGCIRNCEEICGPRWLMPCWLFPCCACFRPMENGMYDSHAHEEIGADTGQSESGLMQEGSVKAEI
jgi:hypothetical protein